MWLLQADSLLCCFLPSFKHLCNGEKKYALIMGEKCCNIKLWS